MPGRRDDRIEILRNLRKHGLTAAQARTRQYAFIDELIEAGFPAREIRAAGYKLDRDAMRRMAPAGKSSAFGAPKALAAGFKRADFHAADYVSQDFKDAGVPCEDLIAVGWRAESFRKRWGDQYKEALVKLADAVNQTGPAAGKKVPPSFLKAAGWRIEELKAAGFHAAYLKTQGAWDSPTEKIDVDNVYGAEEVWRELEKLSETRSVPVTLEQIGKARDSYLEAVQELFKHKDERRNLEAEIRDAKHRLKDVKARKSSSKKAAETKALEKKKEKLENLKTKKKEDLEEIKEKRKALLTVIDRRIDHLKKEVKFHEKKTKAVRSQISDQRVALESAFGHISEMNYRNARDCYPLWRISPRSIQRRIGEIVAELGLPEKVVAAELTHPVEEIEGKKWKLTGAEASKFSKPLEELAVLNAKLEKIDWLVDDLEAEIELLEEVKRIASNEKALWRRVANKAAFKTLLGLARYATTEVCLPLIDGGTPSVAWRRITGRIDLNLEFGASVGAGKADVAEFAIGLSISLSGSLAVEDDRRVRARLTIKLIPNFEVKFLKTGVGYVAKATLALGFTITNQAMAFVDEKHFAHYVAFRIANLWDFTNKLLEYGGRGLEYDHDPYSKTIQRILSGELGGSGWKNFVEEQRYYLTKVPVVKSHTPGLGKLIPTVDLGVESSVIGVSAEASFTHKKTPAYFKKEFLALPETSESEESGPAHQGPRYWEYFARGDGDCAYHSLGFLLHRAGVTNRLWTVNELRDEAADYLEQVACPLGGDNWQYDSATYTSLEDYATWVRGRRVDETGQHRHWADMLVIAALAARFDCFVHIHGVGREAVPLPPPPFEARPDAPVLHLAYRGNNHYNPLLVKDDENAPVALAALPPGLDRKDPGVTAFAGADGGSPKAVSGPLNWRPKQVTVAEAAEERRKWRQSHSPRLVSLGRMGYAGSVTGTFSLDSWVKLSFDVSKIWVDRDMNPDNDGIYRNIKARGSLLQRSFAAPSAPDEVTDAARSAIAPNTAGGDAWEKCAPPSNMGLDNLAKALGPVSIDLDLHTRYLEWNYIYENGKWRRQYIRWNYTSGISVEVEQDVDVYPGVVAGLSLSAGVSKSVALYERLAPDTLSYIQTVFDGLKLRRNGKQQWIQFRNSHLAEFRLLFRRIGEAANGQRSANVYEVVQGYETLIKDNKPIWEAAEDDEWCKPYDGEENDCQLVAACRKYGGSLKSGFRKRVAGEILQRYSKPDTEMLEELLRRLTRLLWRAARVQAVYNARRFPFRRRIKYLVPPQGSIAFFLRWHDGAFYVAAPPTLQPLKHARDAQWQRYVLTGDVWTNPLLRRAESALAFYRAGFAIKLTFKLAHSTTSVEFQPIGTAVSEEDEDEEGVLRHLFLDLAAQCVDKRKENLQDFEQLVHLDNLLADTFALWIRQLGFDKVTYRRFRPDKKDKAKDHYPDDAPGMELLPAPKHPSRTIVDRFDKPLILGPQEVKDSKAADRVKVDGVKPELLKAPLENEAAQGALNDREKWIAKAHLLWDEWIYKKQAELDKVKGEVRSPVELILNEVKGPFPAFADLRYEALRMLDELG